MKWKETGRPWQHKTSIELIEKNIFSITKWRICMILLPIYPGQNQRSVKRHIRVDTKHKHWVPINYFVTTLLDDKVWHPLFYHPKTHIFFTALTFNPITPQLLLPESLMFFWTELRPCPKSDLNPKIQPKLFNFKGHQFIFVF